MFQSRQTSWIEQFFDEKKVTTNGFWELNIIIVTIDEGEWRMSRWGIGTQRRKSVEKNSIFSRDNPQLLVTFRRTLFEVIMSNPAKISIFLRFRKTEIIEWEKKQLAWRFSLIVACHLKNVTHGKNRVLSINQVIVGVLHHQKKPIF